MKHEVPDYTFDPEKESGLDTYHETLNNYVHAYRKKIKEYTLPQLLDEVSNLQIDNDRHAPLGIKILDVIREGIDRHINRNR